MLIAGIDEVGRGTLAGPVMAGAVIFAESNIVSGLKDSKLLTPKRRLVLDIAIRDQALALALGSASVEEIDQLNILQATLLAMERAISALPIKPDLVLVDGSHAPRVPYRVETIIKGDATVPAISAASILAKVARDALMDQYDTIYPEYAFGQHKGYGTALHLERLAQYGITPIHRLSFSPVALLAKSLPNKPLGVVES